MNRMKILVTGGAGVLTNKLKEQIDQLKLNDKVRFLGKMNNDDVIKLFSESDLFVLPSENVVFDVVTLEAMAVGLPVIVTKDGGNLDLIKDGENGFFIEKGNVSQLTSSIEFAYMNKEKVNHIGANGSTFVEKNFSTKKMFDDYYKLYQELYRKIV